jgi:histidine triad (HIT) family protein
VDSCIFCKIAAGTIPAKLIYQDEQVIAFHDINPAAPVHFLIVPREHLPTLADGSDKHQTLLGKMMLLAPKLAQQLGAGYDDAANGPSGGFKALINTGPDGGQTVDHVHFHILGGRELTWPPG